MNMLASQVQYKPLITFSLLSADIPHRHYKGMPQILHLVLLSENKYSQFRQD